MDSGLQVAVLNCSGHHLTVFVQGGAVNSFPAAWLARHAICNIQKEIVKGKYSGSKSISEFTISISLEGDTALIQWYKY